MDKVRFLQRKLGMAGASGPDQGMIDLVCQLVQAVVISETSISATAYRTEYSSIW